MLLDRCIVLPAISCKLPLSDAALQVNTSAVGLLASASCSGARMATSHRTGIAVELPQGQSNRLRAAAAVTSNMAAAGRMVRPCTCKAKNRSAR